MATSHKSTTEPTIAQRLNAPSDGKAILYDRKADGEYALFLDGQFLGYASTYSEGERTISQVYYDQLTHSHDATPIEDEDVEAVAAALSDLPLPVVTALEVEHEAMIGADDIVTYRAVTVTEELLPATELDISEGNSDGFPVRTYRCGDVELMFCAASDEADDTPMLLIGDGDGIISSDDLIDLYRLLTSPQMAHLFADIAPAPRDAQPIPVQADIPPVTVEPYIFDEDDVAIGKQPAIEFRASSTDNPNGIYAKSILDDDDIGHFPPSVYLRGADGDAEGLSYTDLCRLYPAIHALVSDTRLQRANRRYLAGLPVYPVRVAA